MKNQTVGYVRVSSIDQNEVRQLDGIELDRVFTDKASGKDTNRPQLQEALKYVREGDTFTVHSMDRLARNVEDMLRLVRELTERGVAVRFVKENMTFAAGKNDPRTTLMFAMLGAFSQFERELIRERQREGIELAKVRGVYKGRKPVLTPEQVRELNERIKTCDNKAQLARDLGIHRYTLYRYVKQGREDGYSNSARNN